METSLNSIGGRPKSKVILKELIKIFGDYS
jgi:hypothetical protein